MLMQARQRLEQIGGFSPEVIDRVEEVTNVQAQFGNYLEYFAKLGIPDPYLFKGHSILDIKPAGHYDETKARAYHYPMGNANDPNMIFQAATLFAADPSTRLVAIGNPSGPGFHGGGLNHRGRKRVTRGNLRPTVDPLLDYLKQENVINTEHVGYSYGATKAAVAALYSVNYDQNVTKGIHIEPADVKPRNVRTLFDDFILTEAFLAPYVNANQLPAFLNARSESVSGSRYNLGIIRPTNVAIARFLMKGRFEEIMEDTLDTNPHFVANIIWGSDSELAVDSLVQHTVSRLRDKHSERRVKARRLEGQKHAFPNYLPLQTAVVLEAVGVVA